MECMEKYIRFLQVKLPLSKCINISSATASLGYLLCREGGVMYLQSFQANC